MMKKLISLAIVVIMLTVFAVPAMAVQTGAEILEARLDYLAGRLAGNANAQNAISQARQQLADPEFRAGISVAQANAKIAEANAALAYLGDATRLSDLSPEVQARIMAHIEAAAAVSGWTVSLDTIGGVMSIRAVGGATIVDVPTGRVIRQTGVDASQLIAIIVAVIALFGTAMLIAVRTRAGKTFKA